MLFQLFNENYNPLQPILEIVETPQYAQAADPIPEYVTKRKLNQLKAALILYDVGSKDEKKTEIQDNANNVIFDNFLRHLYYSYRLYYLAYLSKIRNIPL